MELLIIILIVSIFLILFTIKHNIKKRLLGNCLPYKKKKYLLTINEKNFYEVLKSAIENTDYYICPMVRMADIIYVDRKKTDKWQYHFNKIVGKHVDFLLCNKETMVPLIAIELDDKSHKRQDRIERDSFVNDAFISANIKLLRFKTNNSYNLNEIKGRLEI